MIELPAGRDHVVTGWAAALAALSTWELVSDSSLAADPAEAAEPSNNLLMMEGDLHKRIRRLIAPFFAPRHIAGLREQLAALAAECVGSLRARPEADLVADLAEPLVLTGILSAMAVPDERWALLGELAREMTGSLEPDLSPDAQRQVNTAALRATMVFQREAMGGTATGLHAALEAAAEAGAIPEKVARITPVVVLHGGYENPLNQLGCVIASAVSDPEAFAVAAGANPARYFEEILRTFSPVRRVVRWAVSEGGGGDPGARGRGDGVWIDLESAHRDAPELSSGGGELPAPRRHLGFGYGRHACPGAALARLEGDALIRSLLTVPAEELGRFTVRWRQGVVAHGPERIVRSAATTPPAGRGASADA